MCGILGSGSTKKLDYNKIKKALDSISHRGPDGSGHYVSDNQKVYFGHRRLSIIDLSRNADQPMIDNNMNVLTFNGEIYNYTELKNKLASRGYRFFSNSDSEVILKSYAEWGTKCFNRFNGMFSLAIYDYSKEKVIIARDRSGEKPLYYSKINGTIKFSSELKALFVDKDQKKILDINSLDMYLAWGYVPGEKSIIKGINKLKSGHFLSFNLNSGESKISCYWSLPKFDTKSNLSFNEIVNKCENLLEDSVSKQLLSSDVPVGVLLSGGVDSSLVTALAARNQNQVNTYTITFPGHNKYDESNHSKLISNYFETNHREIEASEIDVKLLFELSTQFDEPIFDSSMIPTYLVTKTIRKYCKVALGGDGGDELFGGYSTYSRFLQLSRLKFLPLSIRKSISNFSSQILPSGYKGRNWFTHLDCDLDHFIPVPNSPFDVKERLKLYKHFNQNDLLHNRRELNFGYDNDIIQNATRFDFYNYLQEDILVKVDRASMLNSLEVRSPFLDHRLIEFAFKNIPSKFKVNSKQKKIVLKELCKKILPKEFDHERKQGFTVPLSNWLKNDKKWKDFYYDILTSNDCIFNPKFIDTLYKGELKGYQNSEKIFGLLMFELWRKKYSINL